MQVTTPRLSQFDQRGLGRNLGYFLMAPLSALVVLSLILAFTVTTYQSRHRDRVYSGVSVWGIDLSGLSPTEAQAALAGAFPYAQEETIVFTDPTSGQKWQKSPAELGMTFDVERTVEAAYNVGRQGSPFTQLRDMFVSWYYGRSLAPTLVVDENKLNDTLDEVAAAINQPAVNASYDYDGTTADYRPSRLGRRLDVADARDRLMQPMTSFRQAEIELLVHQTQPAVHDSAAVANSIQQILDSPVTFYLQEPLQNTDLEQVVVPKEELTSWLRVELVSQADSTMQHEIFVDENAVRHWLSQFASQIYRQPVNARFYFDDYTRELVVVAPHVNGRQLDVDATLARFKEQIGTPNRSVPFIVNEIVPEVHTNATAAELGITELVSEKTTWFYGSSDARKHNIARAAANFYGIVIAPGEEFSFSKYLGTVSEADGYEEGLIIVGGRTIKGIGGGVCQVSTTMYQTAFWAGFPITERWEHGYMLGYYNDGEGPGMDATVFAPIVDLRFVNNTPHHLLIENYYSEENEALTFKFYSTSMGRRVEKEMLPWENVAPAPTEDVWEYDEDLEPGTVRQIDWATEGADVTVNRTVYNADEQVILQESIRSHYIPYPNVYHYGPGVDAPDYSLIPPEEN